MLTLLCVGCNSKVFYAEYADVDEQGWALADSVVFDVEVTDTNRMYDFLLEVRNNISYPYSNAFFFINTTFPDGSVAHDTLECPLADLSGQWYGKRAGRYVDSRYYFRKNARFPLSGNYRFAITHGLRDSSVVGLCDIGFRIEYSKMK
jgi:gliding motility-associated lipoprotein GldH